MDYITSFALSKSLAKNARILIIEATHNANKKEQC